MTYRRVTGPVVEQAALAWFESLCYAVQAGPDIAPDKSTTPERGSNTDVILQGRLRQPPAQLNSSLPAEMSGGRDGLGRCFPYQWGSGRRTG